MDFTRLRLSGFKSFIDPCEFLIEPGLTGVVGPNGCGKSNLLEALRWVMGAASAKAMRGEGMDDVIFAGSGARPSRNHAEVTLTIDNAARDAPAALNGEPVLEVTRRIDRGEGSTYRVNGREVRARDVQILFADASTGANSPALVRQGQISELIAAKPQNRRRILEEAAGVTGLYGRRHEAELRLAAAAANIDRLDDLARELETGLARLRREARQAARYKALAGEIRTLQSSLLQQKWSEARAAARRAGEDAARADEALEGAARAAAAASAKAVGAQTALAPRREAEAAASAVLGRLAIERDRLGRDLELALAEARRLAAELARIDADDEREGERARDADAALARLEADLHAIEGEIAAAPERGPRLQAAARAAESERARAEAAVEALAAAAAAGAAEARAAAARLAEAEARLTRLRQARDTATAELAGLTQSAGVESSGVDVRQAAEALAGARAELEAADAALGEARGAEAEARRAARTAEDALAGASAEAAALARLIGGPTGSPYAAALDKVAAAPGLEAALAAALGDDLEAALDARAPAFWGGADKSPPAWPKGARPLTDQIRAPAQLAARLAYTALVDAADGERLQAALPPGARLVSREGDLWRWDGFTRRAAAPRPAQARLEQKARLAELEAAIAVLAPEAGAAGKVQAEAAGKFAAAEAAVKAARAASVEAERAWSTARDAAERMAGETARREARGAVLEETARRLTGEIGEAEAADAAARSAAAPADETLPQRLDAARDAALTARESAARARAALDAETRETEGRAARRAALAAERADWSHRGAAAEDRREALAQARETCDAQLVLARQAPAKSEAALAALTDQIASAEARRAEAADALAAAETARGEADREARAADAAAADAREVRAGLAARLEGARERLAEQAAALAAATGLRPADLDRHFGQEAAANDPAPGASEARLAALERERDNMGPVNLRAEEEAAEQGARLAALTAERADLNGALAKLRQAIGELNAEGRGRLLAAFEVIQGHFRDLFVALFQGGQAELRLVDSEDPLEAGLEVMACPPGKRMAVMSLMSGGEQALTAMALIFAVFLSAPAPVCVLDEADAPLDDANVDRFCNLLAAMRARAATRFIVITHNPLTMSRMDRLYGVTMREAGVSQLVSVDLRQAEAIAAQ